MSDEKQTGAQAPYGYLWFDRNMERRFTHAIPKNGPIGECVPIYIAPPLLTPSEIPHIRESKELQRLRNIEHLAWHACESSAENADGDTFTVDTDDFRALSEALPMEHPSHDGLPKDAKR